MSKTRTQVLEESRRKGIVAGAATAATVAAGAALGPGLALVGAIPSALLVYRWWRHRSENGIRF